MKRAKKKIVPKRYQATLTASQRMELARARRISTAGPFPGLRSFFQAHLRSAPMEVGLSAKS